MEQEPTYIFVGNGPFKISDRLDCRRIDLLYYKPEGSNDELPYCFIEIVNGRTLDLDPGIVFKDEYNQFESQPEELFDPSQRPDKLPLHKLPSILRLNA